MASRLETFFEIVEDEGDFVGQRDESLVVLAETSLGVRFPLSYRTFVLKLGAGNFEGDDYYGVIDDDFENATGPDVVRVTMQNRAESNLPETMVVVGSDGMGGQYVLDTAKGAEPPVELWEVGHSGQDLEQVDDSYADFCLRLAQEATDY